MLNSCSLPKPKGVLFDMGGTLLGEFKFDRHAARRRVLELANNPNGATLEDYVAIAAEFHQSIWPKRDEYLWEFPVSSFWRHADERLGISFDMPVEELELEFWKTAVTMRPAPGVTEALDALRDRGLPLGVVSNSAFCGSVISYELERNGVGHFFEFVMSSADFGLRKPHHAIFQTAAAKLGFVPADVWFIGDSFRHDVAGAMDAGMVGIWYNPKATPPEDRAADAEIRHWSELKGLP